MIKRIVYLVFILGTLTCNDLTAGGGFKAIVEEGVKQRVLRTLFDPERKVSFAKVTETSKFLEEPRTYAVTVTQLSMRDLVVEKCKLYPDHSMQCSGASFFRVLPIVYNPNPFDLSYFTRQPEGLRIMIVRESMDRIANFLTDHISKPQCSSLMCGCFDQEDGSYCKDQRHHYHTAAITHCFIISDENGDLLNDLSFSNQSQETDSVEILYATTSNAGICSIPLKGSRDEWMNIEWTSFYALQESEKITQERQKMEKD